MSSHNDPFVASGSSPSLMVCRDCWLTTVGVVPIEKRKQHRDYFVPVGEKPSKQFGLDLGNVRVSTLGTNGSSLHFEFNKLSPQASRLIVDALKASRANVVNLEFHLPNYSLRPNLSRQEAISFLDRVAADFFIENHFSICLLRPITASAREWLENNLDVAESFQPYWPTVVIEHRYVGAILEGVRNDGLGVWS
jgi:hypothetical protein